MTLTIDPLPQGRTARNVVPYLVLGLWGVAILMLAQRGAFVQTEGGPPLHLLLALAVPIGLFLLAWRLVPAVRVWVQELDLALVMGLQSFRVIGIVFVILYFMGQLPLVFAFTAGFGDIAVGILALATTLSYARGHGNAVLNARRLILFGLLDFAMAFGTATFSGIDGALLLPGESPVALMQVAPMVMIPAFGVPVFFILHMIAWIRLSEIGPTAGG